MLLVEIKSFVILIVLHRQVPASVYLTVCYNSTIEGLHTGSFHLAPSKQPFLILGSAFKMSIFGDLHCLTCHNMQIIPDLFLILQSCINTNFYSSPEDTVQKDSIALT